MSISVSQIHIDIVPKKNNRDYVITFHEHNVYIGESGKEKTTFHIPKCEDVFLVFDGQFNEVYFIFQDIEHLSNLKIGFLECKSAYLTVKGHHEFLKLKFNDASIDQLKVTSFDFGTEKSLESITVQKHSYIQKIDIPYLKLKRLRLEENVKFVHTHCSGILSNWIEKLINTNLNSFHGNIFKPKQSNIFHPDIDLHCRIGDGDYNSIEDMFKEHVVGDAVISFLIESGI